MTKNNKRGYFGEYGGMFLPETLIAPLMQLEESYNKIIKDESFKKELDRYIRDYIGRPTPIYFAERLSNELNGARIYMKREDLTHTGSHKINNTIGQGLLAKHLGKTRLIAETGAGQHGVATASVASLLGLDCTIYMGKVDMERQSLNVARMRCMGAEVKSTPPTASSHTLKDAVSATMRDWVSNIESSHYVLGSVVGPHPYPTIVKNFQKIIGIEARKQILESTNKLPDHIISCVGGGSNSIGLFDAFLDDESVKITGVEGGGKGSTLGNHAARFLSGKPGVFQGSKSYVLQDEEGQILPTHSISAGLDYPGVGPIHAHLHDIGRAEYVNASDKEALEATFMLSKTEGIIPALESAHAISYAIKIAKNMSKEHVILVGLSGRGDKDMETINKNMR